MKIYLVLIFIFIGFLVSCEKDHSSLGFEPGPPGSYTYQSYDSLGNRIAGGWIDFEFVNSNFIEGSWKIKNLSDRNDIGPQVGEGLLSGLRIDSSIRIDLTPHTRDNNLLLEGLLQETSFTGTWTWLSLSGSTNWGTFKAIKN